MRGAAQKASGSEHIVPRTLGAPAAEVEQMLTDGPRLAIAAADLAVAVAERATGRVHWRSEAWIDRFGLVDTLNRHLPESHEFTELPLPPAGENWRRSRTLADVHGDELLYDLVLLGAGTPRGTHYVTVLATERIGSGPAVVDRPEVLEVIDDALVEASKSTVAVVYIDLDRFERIVATVGNVQALRLVEQASRKISAAVRGTDMLFRLHGDEFVVLAVELGGQPAAAELGERIRSAVAALPQPAEGMALTASVGVAVNDARQSAHELLAAAETAVHLAKGRGRDRVVLSDEALPSRAERLLSVERQLRRAIEHRQVRFAYQPMVRIRDRRIMGAEALLRIGGDVGLSATEVVATAERSGLMGALGVLLVEGAEEQLGSWLTGSTDERQVMINVAPSQLLDDEFVGLLREISIHRELRTHFAVEIAAAPANDHAELLTSLTSELAPGVGFGIDGLTDVEVPFARYGDLGVTHLKLHRNLVSRLASDADARERTAGLVSAAQAAGVRVIGVGVEKETEREALIQVGCNLAQGFYFSPAVPADDLLIAAGGRSTGGAPGRRREHVADV